jgi:hypothetical protein
MARIQEEVIIITVSKLQKNSVLTDTQDSEIVNQEMLTALTTVTEELLGQSVIVEINKA